MCNGQNKTVSSSLFVFNIQIIIFIIFSLLFCTNKKTKRILYNILSKIENVYNSYNLCKKTYRQKIYQKKKTIESHERNKQNLIIKRKKTTKQLKTCTTFEMGGMNGLE